MLELIRKNAMMAMGPAAGAEAVGSYDILKLLKPLGRHIPLLKIDCEGCEFEVLPRLQEAGVLSGVDRIVGEIHAPRVSAKHALYEQLKLDFCASVLEGNQASDNVPLNRSYPQSELACFERWYRRKRP